MERMIKIRDDFLRNEQELKEQECKEVERTGTTIFQDLKNENDLGPFTRTVRDEKSIDTEYVRYKLSIFNGIDSQTYRRCKVQLKDTLLWFSAPT